MKVILIRHGQTAGNLKRQYIGSTDELLCIEGRRALETKVYPAAEKLLVSPMKRCQESAKLIYKKQPYETIDGLRECHFGLFEGKTYEELKEDERYQRWLNSHGSLPFPEGEDAEAFKARCCESFLGSVQKYRQYESIAFVIHGGTIMAILEKYAVPSKGFYDYQVKNGEGYQAEYDHERKQLVNVVKL